MVGHGDAVLSLDALSVAAGVLLLVTGPAKIGRPAPTAAALGAVGWPASERLARAIGVGETAAALLLLGPGGRAGAVACAAGYLGFSAFLVVALRAGGVPSCGCAPGSDAPPSRGHLAVTCSAAGVLLAAAASRPPSLAAVWSAAYGPYLLASALLVTGLAWIAIAVAPALRRIAVDEAGGW